MKTTNNIKYRTFGFILLGMVTLLSCQSIYDHETDKFCDRIENRNHQQCTGNHMPLPPKK